MGFWSYLFPGDEGELADLFWSSQQTSTGITLKNQTYEGTNGEDTVTFSQSFNYNPYQSEVYLSGGNDAARTIGTSSGTKFYLGDGDDFFTAIDGLRYSRVEGGRGDDTLRINESLWDREGLYHSIITTGDGNDYVLIEKEDRLADSRSGVLGGGIFTGNENDTLIIKGNGLLVQSTGASLIYADGSETLDGIISLGGGDDFLGIYKWNASPPAGLKSAGNSPYLLDSDVYLGGGNDTVDLRSLDFFSSTGVIINGGVGSDIAILPLGITSPPAWLQEFESFVYSPNNGNGASGHIAGNGAFQEGVTLTAPDITADPDGDAVDPDYAYQWFKDGTAIADATEATYAVPLTGAGTYKVAITYTDGLGFQATVESPEQVVSIFNNGNEPPTALNLSETSFAENIASGSTVATLITTDQGIGDTHAYALVSGDGDADNGAFTIEGDQLQINESPDYETKSSYSIRLQTKDFGGLTFEKSFVLDVNDLEVNIAVQSDHSVRQGSLASIPIQINDASGIEAIDLNIAYDQNIFDLPTSGIFEPGELNPEWSFVANASVPGVVSLSSFGSAKLGSEYGSIAIFNLKVKDYAEIGKSKIDIVNVEINENQITSTIADGEILIEKPSFQVRDV